MRRPASGRRRWRRTAFPVRRRRRSRSISFCVRHRPGRRRRRARRTLSTSRMWLGRSASGKSCSATLAYGCRVTSTMPPSRAFPMRWWSAWCAARPGDARPGIAHSRRYAGRAVGAVRGCEPPRGRVIGVWPQAAGRDVSRETFEKFEAYARCFARRADARTWSRRQRWISCGSGTFSIRPNWCASSRRGALRGSTSVRARGCPESSLLAWSTGPVTMIEPRRLRARISPQGVRIARSSMPPCSSRKAERAGGKYDVITARAVASFPQLLEISAHLSTRNTVWALPKGAKRALRNWSKRSAHGKVRSTWNRASPTRGRSSSSLQG